MMNIVEIRDLCKFFGTVRAVDHVSLDIRTGEMLCLLGPSGCGKTTLLRILSGLQEPDSGSVHMSGQDVTFLPPEKRPTALVFQNYALFPHLNVFENIAFGLKVKKMPMAEIRKRVEEMLRIVDLEGKGDRGILQLSGGQQQRVALGRALVMEPKVLLLDEPLSNLDAKLRVETRSQIRAIQRRVGITSIFVTHDQEEALTMADRIAVMNCGQIEQLGTPHEIYHNPTNRFIADFIGKTNFLKGKYDPSTRTFTLGNGLILDAPAVTAEVEDHQLVLRPEYLSIALEKEEIPEGSNILEGVIEDVVFLGEQTEYITRISEDVHMMAMTYGVARSYRRGDSVFVYWNINDGQIL